MALLIKTTGYMAVCLSQTYTIWVKLYYKVPLNVIELPVVRDSDIILIRHICTYHKQPVWQNVAYLCQMFSGLYIGTEKVSCHPLFETGRILIKVNSADTN